MLVLRWKDLLVMHVLMHHLLQWMVVLLIGWLWLLMLLMRNSHVLVLVIVLQVLWVDRRRDMLLLLLRRRGRLLLLLLLLDRRWLQELMCLHDRRRLPDCRGRHGRHLEGILGRLLLPTIIQLHLLRHRFPACVHAVPMRRQTVRLAARRRRRRLTHGSKVAVHLVPIADRGNRWHGSQSLVL